MPDYRAYATLNDWFARRIRPELRPIYGASNPDVRRHTRTRTHTRTHEQVPGAGGGGRRQDARVLQRARYAHVAEGRPGVAGAIARPIGRPGPVLGQRSRDHPSTRAGNARWSSPSSSSSDRRTLQGDYHRFHAPSDATIVSQVVIPGPLYSVSADAMTYGAIGTCPRPTAVLLSGGRIGPRTVPSTTTAW